MSVLVRNVSFSYDKNGPPVLHQLSFEVKRNGFCVIVGPSGTGKSTLLQLLAGFLKPQNGIIEHGSAAHSATHSGAKIRRALVFQYPERHFFQMTVRDELAFGLRRLGLQKEEIDYRIEESLQLLGIDSENMLRRSPFDLSSGEQRLVAIAVALVMQPNLLLLDEPTVGLDGVSRQQLLRAVDDWRRQHDASVLVVSHDLTEFVGRADQVVALLNGELAFDGSIVEFFKNPDVLKESGLALPAIPRLLKRLVGMGWLTDDQIIELYDETDMDTVSKFLARELQSVIKARKGVRQN